MDQFTIIGKLYTEVILLQENESKFAQVLQQKDQEIQSLKMKLAALKDFQAQAPGLKTEEKNEPRVSDR